VDRLITTGVAANRAEALRWALGRVGEAGLDRGLDAAFVLL
jgi:hypothetical protein